jgi:hypothetical protein
MPESRVATIKEVISSAEVLMSGTGEYHSGAKGRCRKKRDVKNNGVEHATLDAKRAALHYLLFSGTDPILRTQQERMRFENQVNAIFGSGNLRRYITWESTTIQNRVTLNNGQGIRLSKDFRVDRAALVRDLETYRIIDRRTDVVAAIGFPQIMVIPDVSPGQNPVNVLRTDPVARHGASVIESHLTAQQYEVIVPQQADILNTLNDAQNIIAGIETDHAYRLALTVGSDIYITFSGVYEDAGFNTKRFGATVRAFETTTARLLGSETGYSQGRQGESTISIEEAINQALSNVLSRVNAYWASDRENGIQYKLVISIPSHFSDNEVDEIQDAFHNAVRRVSTRFRENITTRQTMDYLIWCDPSVYRSSRDVFADIRAEFQRTSFGTRLSTININRKMILLKVD